MNLPLHVNRNKEQETLGYKQRNGRVGIYLREDKSDENVKSGGRRK